MKSPKMMSGSALFLTSLAFLAIAVQARSLPSERLHNKISLMIEYGRALNTPPPSPKSAPPTKQITNIGSDEPTDTNYDRTRKSPPPSPKPSSPESQLQIASPDNGKIIKHSPPPPPASSKPPIQSENNPSPRVVDGNPCSSSSSFIAMVTDQDYGRTRNSPPPSPKPAPPTHNDLRIRIDEQLNPLLSIFVPLE